MSDAARRFELLTWAGSRPDVLELLEELRGEGFEVHEVEQLRRIVRPRALDSADAAPPRPR